jgi:transmembrane sensor
MTEQRVRYLFQRYFINVCTEAESLEFLHLLKQGQQDEDLLRVMEECWETYTSDRQAPGGMAERVLAGATRPRPGLLRSMLLSYRLRVASAAAVLILLAGALFLTGQRPEKKTPPRETAVQKHDILPGGDKAILTLSNGRQIVLDSAANGKLAEQGRTRIIKLDNGQLAYVGGSSNPQDAAYNTISTPNGGHYNVVLTDGTKVWLNAASSLTFPSAFKGSSREVQLKGEGYFEVAPDPSKPFLVKVNDMKVTVLGTSFNIMAYKEEDAVRTTLLDGSVRLSGPVRTRMLTPGQQVSYNTEGEIRLVNEADPDEAIAWKNGRFQFSSTNIQVIMRQIARWYDVKISYEGDVKNETFSGSTPMTGNVSEILKMLELTHTVHFDITDKTITVKEMK